MFHVEQPYMSSDVLRVTSPKVGEPCCLPRGRFPRPHFFTARGK